MKILMIVLMLIISTGAGLYLSSRLDKRVKALEEILLKADEIQTMIRYQSMEPRQILEKVAENSILSSCSYKDGNVNISEEGLYMLDEQDKTILFDLLNGIGKTDTDGQLSMLEMNKSLLQSRLEQAREDYSKKGRMYRSVGVLLGIGAAVTLI
ncbi:MAG: stage III sporulation protein AB [Ruminiclostridium sp.]